MKLIVINGLPGTGKTTIAKPLADKLGLPLIAKDTIKEFLFDTIGTGDREWSKLLGKASSEFIYKLADDLLSNGYSVVIESAFEPTFAKPVIEAFINKYQLEVIELYCTTDKDIRRERFKHRNESGERHKGHIDHVNYLTENDVEPLEKYTPIGIGKLIQVDTTSSRVDVDMLARQIEKF